MKCGQSGFAYQRCWITQVGGNGREIAGVSGDNDAPMPVNDVLLWRRWRSRGGGHYPAKISSTKRPDATINRVIPANAVPKPMTISIKMINDRARTYHGVRVSWPTTAR